MNHQRVKGLSERLTVGLFLAASLFPLIPTGQGNAADYYVRVSGNDNLDGSSPQLAFATVGKAILSCKSNFDRIFIGAGKYSVGVSRAMVAKDASLQFIGDTKGAFTGDKGKVEISGPASNWSIYLRDGGFLSFTGLSFVGVGDGTNYGVASARISRGVTFTDCTFEKTHYGCYAITCQATISDCLFSDVTYIALRQQEGNLDAKDCQFDNCRYGVYANLATISVDDCKFQSDESTFRLAVYSNKSSAALDNLEIQGYGTAVQCENSTQAALKNLEIEGISSWGVYATGTNLSATRISVLGTSRKGNGLCLRDLNGGQSVATKCQLQGLSTGVYFYGEPCEYQNVKVVDCNYGYYSNGASSTVIDGKKDLSFDNNYIAVMVNNPASQPGSLELNKVTLSNNDYAVYTNNSSFSAVDCKFEKNSRGVYIRSAPTASLVNCRFSDNTGRNAWSHWGARLEASQIFVHGCQFRRNDSGLVLVNQSDQEPKLTQVTLTDNKDYGLLAYNGNLTVANDSQVQISGSSYGLMTQNTRCVIKNWTAPTKCNYPVYVNRGSLEMDGTDVSGGTISVYTTQTEFSKINSGTFANSTNTAIYSLQSLSTIIENCQFQKSNNAINVNGASAVQISKCNFASLKGSAVLAQNQSKLSVTTCAIDQCKNYGIYCTMASPVEDAVTLADLQIANCSYGMYFSGVPISDSSLQKIRLTKNQYALRVHKAPLKLSGKASVEITDNVYGLMNYDGQLDLDGIQLVNNQIGVYGSNSPAMLSNCQLSSSNYGCLLYRSVAELQDVSVQGGNYGIFFDPQSQAVCSLTVTRAQVSSAVRAGIYSVGRTEPSTTNLSEITIEGSGYGVYCSGGEMITDRVAINNSSNIGLYVINTNSQHDRLKVTNGKTWGIYGNKGQMSLSRTEVRGGNGVRLNTQTSRIASSLVSGATYGVYTQLADGKYEVINCTLADLRYDGVYAAAGSVSIVNSIIQAGRNGLVALNGRSSVASDYNIVKGNSRAYRNVAAGPHDIDKVPIFVNAATRDYRLGAGSPAINSGTDLSSLISVDLDGNARGSFGGFEIGAYEFMNPSGSVRIVQWQETAQ